MYSGITQGLYPVVALEQQPGLCAYQIELNEVLVAGLKTGASIAIDGVCQTVAALDGVTIVLQAMQETLARTTLSSLKLNQLVSVERSLKVGDESGGHNVSGHVDGVANVIEIDSSENNLALKIQCDKAWMKYILAKGFIAVNGSSLTVGDVGEDFFFLHLIPETLRLTNFANLFVGDAVNIEFDRQTKTIVDTVERLVAENVNG